MNPSAPDLPALASALIRLRRETLGQIAQATTIRTANLSVWLRGKPQVISERRVVALMHHLGIVNGRLRDDLVHVWHDAGPMADLKLLLNCMLSQQTSKHWVTERNPSGLEKTHFLLADKIIVKLVLSPGVADSGDLAELMSDYEKITVDEPLASLPNHSIESACTCLVNAMTLSAPQEGKQFVIENMLKRLDEATYFIYLNPTEQAAAWGELEMALIAALERNLCPRTIARHIRQHLSTLSDAE